jgi:hypothetical protein
MEVLAKGARVMATTSRVAVSWDQEFKPRLDELFPAFADSPEGSARIHNIDMFLICLSYGFSTGMKRPIPPRVSDAVRLESLKDSVWAVFRSIAVADTGSANVLKSDDAVLDVVEQFAAGGLELLVKKFDEDSTQIRSWLTGDYFKAITKSPYSVKDSAS